MYLEDQSGTDLTVTMGDKDYDAEATVDVDSDGVDDTAMVHRNDGSALAFSDTDSDGRADLRTELDARGQVTGQAELDAGTGEWVGVPGPPTHDTDGDGVNDTLVVAGERGVTRLLTDVDGDGGAEVATEITADGQVTVSERDGDGEWAVVERGTLDGPAVSVDPVTGRWVRG